ncbi:cytoplasmic dynein 1 light intermediate chain 2-like [Corticium candelabrum]|uniref:cytoplasmic dynein 1 light intermediate chain 2-like n=1 Tax=Corticium candelabrum TaxID=121492 RepID=UPI002E270878|nr:cytoplasmic dynein 1 light intermediate chain 2-like [Corticium candelabrum]
MAESEDLWASILSDVARASRKTNDTEKTLLILGEDGAGKSSLVNRLRGRPDDVPTPTCGYMFSYIAVQDEDSDETSSSIRVWTLDVDRVNALHLGLGVNSRSIESLVVVIVVDMSTPWTIMETLETWTKLLKEHVDGLQLPSGVVRELEERNIKAFQEYKDPEELTTATAMSSSPHAAGTEAASNVVLPLTDNVLSHNLGIPLAVVCNKCDLLSVVEKELGYNDEYLDFIQQHLRKFCLKYGAMLVYLSAKTGKNCHLLNKFVLHKLCSHDFRVSAYLTERDSIFIPPGWDNVNKISFLYQHLKVLHPDDVYETRIVRPAVKNTGEEEIIAEDDQLFLMRLMRLQSAAPIVEERKAESSHLATPRATPPKLTDARSSAGGETVLTTFFNSLLQKKSGTSTASTAKATDKDLSADAADALQAMQSQKRGRKPPKAE